MGHYDECREGYCGVCGQTEGNCVHTKSKVTATQPTSNNVPEAFHKVIYALNPLTDQERKNVLKAAAVLLGIG
jgi:hypothetical protein